MHSNRRPPSWTVWKAMPIMLLISNLKLVVNYGVSKTDPVRVWKDKTFVEEPTELATETLKPLNILGTNIQTHEFPYLVLHPSLK